MARQGAGMKTCERRGLAWGPDTAAKGRVWAVWAVSVAAWRLSSVSYSGDGEGNNGFSGDSGERAAWPGQGDVIIVRGEGERDTRRRMAQVWKDRARARARVGQHLSHVPFVQTVRRLT